MALTPKVLAVLKKVDAAHAEFFAVLELEARMKRPHGDGQGEAGRKPPRRQDGRQKPEARTRGSRDSGSEMVVESIRRSVEGIPAPVEKAS